MWTGQTQAIQEIDARQIRSSYYPHRPVVLVEQANQESNGDTMAGLGATRFSSSTTVSRALGIIIRVDYYDLAMAKGMNE